MTALSLVATATRHANGAWPDLVRGGEMTHSATGTITVDGKSYNFDVSRRTVRRPAETGVDYVAALYNPGSARELTAPKHEPIRSALIQAFKRKVQAMAGDTRVRGEDWLIAALCPSCDDKGAAQGDCPTCCPAKPAPIKLRGFGEVEKTERLPAPPMEAPAAAVVSARVIDVTPTWEGLVPAFLALIENGNAEGRATAVAELTRMAKAADKANAYRAQRDAESARAVAAEKLAGDRLASVVALQGRLGDPSEPFAAGFRAGLDYFPDDRPEAIAQWTVECHEAWMESK